jgi:CDP-diacylglycerol--glycerol-3-phosphate 3-phosphatidyltransferase
MCIFAQEYNWMMRELKYQAANVLTYTRMVVSVALLFIDTFSAFFYICYVFCGISDMIDGFIARKTHTESDKGAKLDSIADLLFIIACLIKILPVLDMPLYLWIWVGVIALVKIPLYICSMTKKRNNVFLHTFANKAVGFLLFLLPLTLSFIPVAYSAIPVCVVATYAAVQEGCLFKTPFQN